jgi:hypothetical protein
MKIQVAPKLVVNGRTIHVDRYRSRVLAEAARCRGDQPLRVMLGDDGLYWVCSPADASRLEKAGYEYAD